MKTLNEIVEVHAFNAMLMQVLGVVPDTTIKSKKYRKQLRKRAHEVAGHVVRDFTHLVNKHIDTDAKV